MVSKPTGRKRGKPKKPFAQDPDRWDLALVERHVLAGVLRGYSELQMHDLLATLAAGAIVRNRENIARFEAELPTLFWMPPHKKFPQRRPIGPSSVGHGG